MNLPQSAVINNIVVLGDNVNFAARLVGVAGIGELVLSEAARAAASLDIAGWRTAGSI